MNKGQRPIPSTKDELDPSKIKPLYEEKDDIVSRQYQTQNFFQGNSSLIRQDDVEVYLRIQTYRNKIFRLFDKFITEISWLPYHSRFEIWEQSRVMMQDFKIETYEKFEKLKVQIGLYIKMRLQQNGIIEERIVSAVIEKFTKSIKGPDGGSSVNMPRLEYLLNSHKANHERPPILTSSIIEMKLQLTEISKEYGITGDLEVDNGHMFTYKIQVFFPTHFYQQALNLEFDQYDTNKENDYINIERILKNINQSDQSEKLKTILEMKKITEKESKKSTIGHINADVWKKNDQLGIKSLKDAAKENNINGAFFTLEESQFKLKKADWLQYVCFEGNISEAVKRQSLYLNQVTQYDSLLESAFNFLDVNDASIVNIILDDSTQAHLQKAQQRNQTRAEKQMGEDDELEAYLKNSLLKKGQAQLEENQRQQLQELKEQIKGAEKPLNLSDPIPNHLIKGYYSLRFLKSRDYKIKLLHVLNFFRSVQKRLSLDLKDLFTRNRSIAATLDGDIIPPQFEKSEQLSNVKFKEDTTGGPGNLFISRFNKKIDGDFDNDPVNFKGLKFNKQFDPSTSSTCPCVPKYHSTYDRPRLYEDISKEFDRKDMPLRFYLKRQEGHQDKWEIDVEKGDVLVFDEYGIKVIYKESLNDMLEIEEELIKIGTYFINETEHMVDPDLQDPASAVDRGDVTLNLIQCEAEFQFQKVMLVQKYMEAYEHCLDPLEIARLAQVIADIMVLRPRINVEGSYFVDCYRNEIKVLQQKQELLREIIDLQMNIESTENEDIRLFNELKYRKIQEYSLDKWFYNDQNPRKKTLSASEEEQHKRIAQINSQNSESSSTNKVITMEEMREQVKQQDEEKKKRMKEIAAKHASEYLNEQYQDFEEILGIEEIKKQLSNKDTTVIDPHIVDIMKEMAFFTKQVDGYPWYIEQDPFKKVEIFGPEAHRVGVFDFFESISTVSKIEAAIQQSLGEMIKIHQPENGFAISSMERALVIEARGRLKLLRNGLPLITESLKVIEDDFYLGNPDKIMFLMKEFKAHLSPELIIHYSNPLLVAKLDPKSVGKFDFPRVKEKDLIKESEDLNPDQILKRMIDIAKSSVTGDGQEKGIQRIGKLPPQKLKPQDEDFFIIDSEEDLKQIKSPSLMIMSCNLIESIRLREEIIQRAHETDVLSVIYKKQLTNLNKSSTKLILSDQINFDTSKIMTDSMNLVDYNDGSRLEIDLPFREFDQSLKANLDFRSESCIKALLTNLGVEELRAILHYQMMQLQILQIGVMHNQVLMDGSQKALYELDFLAKKKPFVVPNSLLNLPFLISRSGEGNVGETISRERNKFKQILSRDVGDFAYLIDAKKNKLRPVIAQKFQSSVLRLNNSFSTEVKLRLLRSQRIKLLHCYCTDVLKEAYEDSIKIQAISSTNQLRSFSMIFPQEQNMFQYGLGSIQENLPLAFTQDNKLFDKEAAKHRELDIGHIFMGEILFYIPSTNEIVRVDPLQRTVNADEFQVYGGDEINENLIDGQIKELVKLPSQDFHYVQDDGIVRPLRKVNFASTYPRNSKTFKILNFVTLLYRSLKLKYLMYRNSPKSLDILELEDHILNGRSFWTSSSKDTNLYEATNKNPQFQVSQRVIQKIIQRKKSKQDLAEDLLLLSKKVKTLKNFMNRQYISSVDQQNGQIERVIELLTIYSTTLHKRFMMGLDQMMENYIDKKSELNLQKIMKLRDDVVRKVQGIRAHHENGFNQNQFSLQSLYLDTKKRSLGDIEEFLSIYKPYVDEQNLIPKEISLVKNLFSRDTVLDTLNVSAFNRLSIRDYAYLEVSLNKDNEQYQNSFFDMNDEQRAYAFSNFMTLDDNVRKYLKYKGLKLGDNTIKEMMIAELDYFSLETDSKHFQHLYICFLNKGDLPRTLQAYKKVQRQYKDHCYLKIVQERDQIMAYEKAKRQAEEARRNKRASDGEECEDKDTIELMNPPVRKTEDNLAFGQSIDNDSLREILEMDDQKIVEHHFVTQLCERKAEINLIKRLVEVKLLRASLNLVKREHSSLLATFDQVATEKPIISFIHPEQQFANTLAYSSEQSPHLDVTNKLASVQQFITRLRNRCTEVETLTSGIGIVFSLKDFNECLQNLCRSLIKYGNQELSDRVNTATIKENQYKHLLYLKEQQCEYYRDKCKTMMKEKDKEVNAKLSQRGGQLLYELDLSTRELRLLKDHIYLLENTMRQEIKNDYERTIANLTDELARYKANFGAYKSELNNWVKEEVAVRIGEVGNEVKQMVQKKKFAVVRAPVMRESKGGTVFLQGQNHNLASDIDLFDDQSVTTDEAERLKDVNRPSGYYDEESMKEINALTRLIRKHKIFSQFKFALMKEKAQRDLNLQHKRLTSNQCLWDQLAESEKRENVLRQELYYAQQNLATYEKIVSKLQHQLESLQSEKLRLLQFKSAKSKQIEALENKIKEVEILENVDLGKVIEELKSREGQLKRLSDENKKFNERIDLVYQGKEKEVSQLKKQLTHEREMKSRAIDQLESMRIEIKAIEGKDMGNSDLWKVKCKELFEICKDLQVENEELKMTAAQLAQSNQISAANLVPRYTGNVIQQAESKGEDSQTHYYAMAPGISDFQQAYRQIPQQLHSFDRFSKDHTILSSNEPTTKPSTAGGNRNSRIMSRGGQRQNHQSNLNVNMHGPDGTLTSGMSFPEIVGQETSEDGRSPMSSLHHQKSGFKEFQLGVYPTKSRDTTRITAANPQIMSSGESLATNQIFTTTGGFSNDRGVQKRFDNKQSFSKGRVSQKNSDGLHLGEIGEINTNILPLGLKDLKSVGGNIARSTAGIVFNSGEITQLQSRGSNLIQQNKFQAGKRLMTSKGPRRIVPDQSTTGTLQSSNLNFKDAASSLRKSGAGGMSTSTSRAHPQIFSQQQPSTQPNNAVASANLAAGLAIANASLPFNPAQLLSSGVRGQPINLNINFNTTHINMKK